MNPSHISVKTCAGRWRKDTSLLLLEEIPSWQWTNILISCAAPRQAATAAMTFCAHLLPPAAPITMQEHRRWPRETGWQKRKSCRFFSRRRIWWKNFLASSLIMQASGSNHSANCPSVGPWKVPGSSFSEMRHALSKPPLAVGHHFPVGLLDQAMARNVERARRVDRLQGEGLVNAKQLQLVKLGPDQLVLLGNAALRRARRPLAAIELRVLLGVAPTLLEDVPPDVDSIRHEVAPPLPVGGHVPRQNHVLLVLCQGGRPGVAVHVDRLAAESCLQHLDHWLKAWRRR